jgi:hypothetical protein
MAISDPVVFRIAKLPFDWLESQDAWGVAKFDV